MRRTLATLAVLVLSASSVVAQVPPAIGRPPGPGSPGYRPPISPYLNLGQAGDPAINYYGVVRPQLDNTQTFQQIQQQLLNPQTNVVGAPGTIDPLTGLPTGPGAVGGYMPATTTTAMTGPLPPGFFTQGRYYMTVRPMPSNGLGGGGGGGSYGGGTYGGGITGGVNRQPNFGIAGAR